MRCRRQTAVALASLLLAAAHADWSNVVCAFLEGEASTVMGPGMAYESTRPDRGDWTASFDLRNHFAGLGGHDIRVHSASVVRFGDYNVASGHSGHSSHISFWIRLSEPVTGVRWDIGRHGKDLTPDSVLAARYSRDGRRWHEAYTYAPGESAWDPPAVELTFEQPTRDLYIGWFAEVPAGGRAWWDLPNTGVLTFAAATGLARPMQEASPKDGPPTVDLHGPRTITNRFFGSTTHVHSEHLVELLKNLGLSTVRIDFLWSGLEPERGRDDVQPEMWMNRSANLGVAQGLDLLPVVTRAPAWAMAENGTFPNDDSAEALEEFCFRLATRYRGRITHWQAMNEPNMAVWRDRYLLFLKAFHRGIKRADASNKVVLCGFAGVEAMHLEAVYRLGGRDYFDVIAAHPYTRPRLPEEGGYLERIQALHQVMTRHGDSKPLWVTEMGWNGVEPSMLEYLRSTFPSHRSYACSEEDQARGLARLYLISATVPWIERVYFFHLAQEAPYTEVMEPADFYMGLFTPWLEGRPRPKDAYFAVKTVIGMLDGSTFRERLDLGSRVWALVFERNDEALVALWSLDDGVTVELTGASMIQSVTSMVGTPVLVSGNRLRLSGRPVYAKARRADLESLRSAIHEAEVMGGESFRLALSLDSEQTTASQPALAVHITNTSRRARVPPTLHLAVRPPTWELARERISDGQAITGGGTRCYSVQLMGAAVRAAEVSFVATAGLFDDSTQVRSERTIRYLLARWKPAGFAADGRLDEWSQVPAISLGATPDQREIVAWRGADDCSGRWYCASDERALYIAAEIRDDTHHQTADATTADALWRCDSIQIALDLAGDAQPVANLPQYDGVNDVELGVALTADGPLAYAWENPQGTTGIQSAIDVAVVRSEADGVTRYEVALPWTSLGLHSAPQGRWLGMNILVNDDDGKGRRGWLEWAPGIGYSKDPSQFPKVFIASAGDRE